jgi:fucose 4-O-acetylase-like acetyltransferase
MEIINGRIKWIDYAKGIGIILVILGHALANENILHIYSYSFHLPLFFFVAGITIKPKYVEEAQLKDIIIKNAKGILIPYYFYGFFVLGIELLKNMIQSDGTVTETVQLFTRWLFLRGIKADWFLPCLFFSKILFTIIIKYIRNIKVQGILFSIIVLFALYFPYRTYHIAPFYRAMIGAFFVFVGFVYTEYAERKVNSILIKIIISVMWVILAFVNGKVSLYGGNYGNNQLLYLVNGVLGSLALIFLVQWMDRRFNTIKSLSWVGKKSLIIMVVHMEIMAFVKVLVMKIGVLYNTPFLFKLSIIVSTILISIACVPLVDMIYDGIFRRKKAIKSKEG